MQSFVAHASRPGVLIWKPSNARAIGAGITAAMLGLIALGGAVANVGALFAPFGTAQRFGVVLLLALLTIFFAALARVCWRQARGQFGFRIELEPAAIVLALPPGRSLVHRPEAVTRRVAASEVVRVLTREEAFAAQWLAMLQQTFWLELAGGERILLFEDRARGTRYATPGLMPIAEAIARHFDVPIETLPAVEGRGGVLGAWFANGPARDAPPLEPARRAALARRIAMTGIAVAIALGAVVLSMALG